MSEEDFNPHSVNATLGTIIQRLDDLKEGQLSARTDFLRSQERVYERFEAHANDIAALKTSDALRVKQVKWAVGGISVVGWLANAWLTWKHGA
jgi:hypothetical protein